MNETLLSTHTEETPFFLHFDSYPVGWVTVQYTDCPSAEG